MWRRSRRRRPGGIEQRDARTARGAHWECRPVKGDRRYGENMIAPTGSTQPGDPQVYTERRLPSFDLKIAQSGRMLLARVSGPLDSTTAETFEQRLRPHCARSGRVVLDLRLADYVDSTGVRSL